MHACMREKEIQRERERDEDGTGREGGRVGAILRQTAVVGASCPRWQVTVSGAEGVYPGRQASSQLCPEGRLLLHEPAA